MKNSIIRFFHNYFSQRRLYVLVLEVSLILRIYQALLTSWSIVSIGADL